MTTRSAPSRCTATSSPAPCSTGSAPRWSHPAATWAPQRNCRPRRSRCPRPSLPGPNNTRRLDRPRKHSGVRPMAEITAAMVRALRDKTGAGMMDCKKALTETAGDMEAAVDWLRKKGLSQAAKKSGRVAAEGLVGVASAPGKAAMVEVNAETDFVARNEAFQGFVENVAKVALEVGDDVETIRAAAYPGTGRTVAEELTQLVATIGENMTLRRAKVMSVANGVVATYTHQPLRPGLGKIGVLVGIEGSSELETLGRQVGMHVAATMPEALDTAGVDPAALER